MGGILLLEDGKSFTGEAFGARGTRVGEVVFNTAMTGYQELMTRRSSDRDTVIGALFFPTQTERSIELESLLLVAKPSPPGFRPRNPGGPCPNSQIFVV